MALRNIIQEGDAGLKKPCKSVTKFDDRLAQLLDDMAETMHEADGLGLAAPQVGVLRSVFIALEDPQKLVQADDEEVELVVREFINPEIIEEEGVQYAYEGCLSFPGLFGAVRRPKRVVVRAQDRYGNTFTMEGEDLMARCFCHETDHLKGVTFDTLADHFYDPDDPHELDSEFLPEEDDA